MTDVQFIIYNCISYYERKIRRRISYQRRVDSYARTSTTEGMEVVGEARGALAFSLINIQKCSK